MSSLDELMADARWNELLWMTRYTANVKKSTKKKKALYFVRMSQRFFIHLLLFCVLSFAVALYASRVMLYAVSLLPIAIAFSDLLHQKFKRTDVFQCNTRSPHDRPQGVFGHVDGKLGFCLDPFVQST